MFVVCEFGVGVSPNIFSLMFMGSMVSICSASCVLYSAGSGVKRVHVVLSGLRMRSFVSMYVFPVGMIKCLLLLCREFYWCLWCWSVRCVYVE